MPVDDAALALLISLSRLLFYSVEMLVQEYISTDAEYKSTDFY